MLHFTNCKSLGHVGNITYVLVFQYLGEMFGRLYQIPIRMIFGD